MEVTIIIPALTLSIIFPEKTIVFSQVMMGIRNLGEIGGDMFKSVYDPNDIGADAFSMANMQETEEAKIMTGEERSALGLAVNHAGTDHAPANAQRNVQSDWSQKDENDDSFIHNKPHHSEAYPVGSIFLTIIDDLPENILGYGSWQSFGRGRMLIGVDPDDRDFDRAEVTGGSKIYTPSGTNSEPLFIGTSLPTHQHAAKSAGTPAGSLGTPNRTTPAGGSSVNVASSDHSHTFTGTAMANHIHDAISAGKPTGSVTAPEFTGKEASILNPFITVYMWLRIDPNINPELPKS